MTKGRSLWIIEWCNWLALPRGGPHIQGVQQDVKIGDYISLNCTSLKSKPAANLTFYINGRNVRQFISSKNRSEIHTFQASEMRRVHVSSSLITNEDHDRHVDRESSILSLNFKVKKHHVRDARIEIRCDATIFNIYNRSKLEEIFVKTHEAENLATHNYEYSSKATAASRKYHQTIIIAPFLTTLFVHTMYYTAWTMLCPVDQHTFLSTFLLPSCSSLK